MYVKIIYREQSESSDFKMHEYTQALSVLSTADGISIEFYPNEYDVYLHRNIHSIEIKQEKPEQ